MPMFYPGFRSKGCTPKEWTIPIHFVEGTSITVQSTLRTTTNIRTTTVGDRKGTWKCIRTYQGMRNTEGLCPQKGARENIAQTLLFCLFNIFTHYNTKNCVKPITDLGGMD